MPKHMLSAIAMAVAATAMPAPPLTLAQADNTNSVIAPAQEEAANRMRWGQRHDYTPGYEGNTVYPPEIYESRRGADGRYYVYRYQRQPGRAWYDDDRRADGPFDRETGVITAPGYMGPFDTRH